MDTAAIEDLKVYLATILSQQVGGLRTDMEHGLHDLRTDMEQGFRDLRTDMEQGFRDLRTDMEQGFRDLGTQITAVNKKIDDLSESVGEAFHNFDQATDKQLKDHEKRITKLETASV